MHVFGIQWLPQARQADDVDHGVDKVRDRRFVFGGRFQRQALRAIGFDEERHVMLIRPSQAHAAAHLADKPVVLPAIIRRTSEERDTGRQLNVERRRSRPTKKC